MKIKKCLLSLFIFLSAGGGYAQQITVTDIVGRKVTLEAPAKRIILGEGRTMITLSLFYDNPAEVVVGWMSDFKVHGGYLYDRYEKKFPEIGNIKSIGAMGKETVSTEQIIALKPDLAIFSSGSHGPDAKSASTIRQLEAAGIPIVFIDFRLHPIKNTVPSIDVLGKVLGKEKKAKEFIDFYNGKLDEIQQTLSKNPPAQKPKVYMEMLRGKLSGTPGKGNMGEYIEWVGGRNIGDILPGEVGELNLEYVIEQQPDIYIITGLALPGTPGFVIGPDITTKQARQSLHELLQRPGISTLRAVKSENVFGLWHLFYDSPLNIVAIEVLAKWVHPDIFGYLIPQKTINELNSRFLAVPLWGTFYTEYKD